MMMVQSSYRREVELEGERTALVKNKWSSTGIDIHGYKHFRNHHNKKMLPKPDKV